MGCTFDRFNTSFEKREHAEKFTEIYNQLLKDDLYWDEPIDMENFDTEYGVYELWIEAEPLFSTMENGEQFVDVILTYLQAVPDYSFHAEYECTFSNCGAIVLTEYNYKDGILEIENRAAEQSALDHCPECEWDICDNESNIYDEEDAVCTLENYDPDEIYTCPSCGAILEWDVDIWTTKYVLRNGEFERVEE